MKKLLITVSTLVLALILVACTGESTNLQDAWDRLQLDVTDLNNVTGTVELPTELAHGTKATWTSSNEENAAVVSRRGATYAVIEQPLHSEGEKQAKLTATLELSGSKKTKDFDIKIPVLPEDLVELTSIAALRALEIGGKEQPSTLPVRLENAVVVGIDQDAYYVTDGTDVTLVFTQPVGLAVGDKGTVVGDAAIYYDAFQISSAAFVVKEVEQTVTPKAVELSAYNFLDNKNSTDEEKAAIKAAKSSSELIQLVTFKALVVLRPDFTGGANYQTTLVGKDSEGKYNPDANFVLSYYKQDNHNELAKYNGQEVEITATVRELRDSRALTVGVSKPVFSLSIQTIGTATAATADNKVLVDSIFTIESNYPKSADLVLPTKGKTFETAITWALVDEEDASFVNLTTNKVTAQDGLRKEVKVTATIGTITKEFTIYVGDYINKTIAEFKADANATSSVRVTGVVTADLATSSTGTGTYTISDATGSIAVRIPSADRAKVKVGTEVELVGKYNNHQGLLQVDSIISVVAKGTKAVPAAVVANALTDAQLKENQSKLALLENVKVTDIATDSYKNITLSFEGLSFKVKWDSRISLSAELEAALKAIAVDDVISITSVIQGSKTFSFAAVSTITVAK